MKPTTCGTVSLLKFPTRRSRPRFEGSDSRASSVRSRDLVLIAAVAHGERHHRIITASDHTIRLYHQIIRLYHQTIKLSTDPIARSPYCTIKASDRRMTVSSDSEQCKREVRLHQYVRGAVTGETAFSPKCHVHETTASSGVYRVCVYGRVTRKGHPIHPCCRR